MSILKYLVLGALAIAALVLRPGTAEASLENHTQAWCKPRTDADQTIVDGAFAQLIFKADGDLVLQPLNHLVKKIWSSGTGGTGAKLCLDTSGALAIYDAAGARLWSRSGGSVPEPGPGTYPYDDILRLSQCNLQSRYRIYYSTSDGWSLGDPIRTRGTLWSQDAACPVVSQSVVGDDWCLDNTAEREIVQTPWSKLVWKPGGSLALVGTGISEGQVLWSTPTAGAGQKLCFEPTGRLAIFDSLERAIWSTTPDTTTTRSHLLSLDNCSLDIKPADGSAPMWTSPRGCPQTTMLTNTSVTTGPSDVVLLENEQATAAFSLRFVPGADVDALIEQSLGRPQVALAAIRAAAYRDPAPASSPGPCGPAPRAASAPRRAGAARRRPGPPAAPPRRRPRRSPRPACR